MRRNRRLIILGGGPAAVEAAARGADAGLDVTLISSLPVGGRAAFGSLLPSKVWLHEAESHRNGAPDVAGITSSIRATQQSWSTDTAAKLRQRGVHILSGTARLRDRRTVVVRTDGGDGEGGGTDEHAAESAETELAGEFILIATGSEPIFFEGMRPDGERIIAPRHTQKLTELPASLTMVGGGVTGCEYALAFRRLGATVRLVTDMDRLLPRTDPELSEALRSHFADRGMEIVTSTPVKSVSRRGDGGTVVTTADGNELLADYAFIATGRGPDTEVLDEALETPERDPKGWIVTDENGATSIPDVYAAGDVTGPPLTANKAHLEARRAVTRMAGGADPPRPALIEAVYTEPHVAHVGPVAELDRRPDVVVHRKSYAELLLPRIHGQPAGFFKLWTDRETDRILGAAAIGEKATEVLSAVQLAMEHGLTHGDLARTPLGHPTLSELVTR